MAVALSDGSLLVAGISLSAQRGGGPPASGAKANPAIGNREAIADGEKLYNETCTACHGKDGKGGELGPPVASQNRRYLRRTDNEIFEAVKDGISGTQMPPFRDSSLTIRSGASPRTSAVFAARPSTRRRRAMSPAAKPSSGARGTAEAATW